jgi:methylmalonyl-CoA mutase
MTPQSAYELWRAGVVAELGPTPFSRLVSPTSDGFGIEPLYVEAPAGQELGVPGEAPFVRGGAARPAGTPWWIAQRVVGDDPARANHDLLADLAGGANAVRLELPAAVSPTWLARAFDGVVLDAVLTVLEPPSLEMSETDPRAWLPLWRQLEQAHGHLPGAAVVHLRVDLERLRSAGISQDLVVTIGRDLVELAGLERGLVADAVALHGAGASPALELGALLASLVEQLRWLDGAGVAPGDAASRFALRLATGSDVLLAIAKLRAARKLWALVLGGCGVVRDAMPAPFLDVITSLRAVARHDPWVNAIRATTEVFAAVCGGADALEVVPLDARLGPDAGAGRSGDFGRRLARNTQVVLAEEAGLGRVVDPLGGSYAIEQLTESLVEAGWKRLQEIEARGGYAAVRRDGTLARWCEDSWRGERQELRTRKRPLTGVSEFAILAERPVPGSGDPTGRVAGHTVGSLPLRPLGGDFELLRAAAASAPHRPTVFLANLGSPAEFGARAGFMANLAAAGGIAAIEDPGTGSLDPAAAAQVLLERFRASGAALVCVCGADGSYASHGAAVVAALAGLGPKKVLVAGRPGALEEGLRAAGADSFVALGNDVVTVLADLLDACGVVVPEQVRL